MKRPAFPIAIASVSDAYDKMVSFDEAEFNDAIAELMAQFEVDEADATAWANSSPSKPSRT